MAAMYAVYHGPDGLKRIAQKVHALTQVLKALVEQSGYTIINADFFDTLTIDVSGPTKDAEAVHAAALAAGINLRRIDDAHVGVTLDESVGIDEVLKLANVFASAARAPPLSPLHLPPVASAVPAALRRTSAFLPHAVFNAHHSETEMLRYIYALQAKDLGLVHAMIPLGSCTMKLNSTSSMIPLTFPEFANVHPFAPLDQVEGYLQVIKVRVLRSPCSGQDAERLDRSSKLTCARSLASMRARCSPTRERQASTLVSLSSGRTTSLAEKAIATSASFL